MEHNVAVNALNQTFSQLRVLGMGQLHRPYLLQVLIIPSGQEEVDAVLPRPQTLEHAVALDMVGVQVLHYLVKQEQVAEAQVLSSGGISKTFK